MKKEKSKDLRPKLISEKYGMSPIKYEKKNGDESTRFVAFFIIFGVILLIFLFTLFIIL